MSSRLDKLGVNIDLDKLRTLRTKMNFSQADMAEPLLMTCQGYSNLELGNRDIRLQQAKIIADKLKLTVDELFFA